MSSRRVVLESKDLVAGYLPGVDILTGCNFKLYQGELVGIIGPNGAGKSTLVKSMFGLVEVRSGVVQLLNEEITNLAAHELVRKGCLLYTSPSPRDSRKSRMPSSA